MAKVHDIDDDTVRVSGSADTVIVTHQWYKDETPYLVKPTSSSSNFWTKRFSSKREAVTYAKLLADGKYDKTARDRRSRRGFFE